jgi:hypothetical protein
MPSTRSRLGTFGGSPHADAVLADHRCHHHGRLLVPAGRETAKTLALTIRQTLLATANDLIE